MLRQHESKYVTRDPLHHDGQPSPPAGPLHSDQECRAKMAAWCFQVAKFCKFQLESIEIALSCFDRFLTTEPGVAALQDRSTYQLACMVCLYTAVKVHERTAMSPAIVAALARDDGRCARRHGEPQVGTKKRVPVELRNGQCCLRRLIAPRRSASDDGVGKDEHLPGTGDECTLVLLSGAGQPSSSGSPASSSQRSM